MYTNEIYELVINGEVPTTVETIPGWAHDVTNSRGDEMVVIPYVNEIFDYIYRYTHIFHYKKFNIWKN